MTITLKTVLQGLLQRMGVAHLLKTFMLVLYALKTSKAPVYLFLKLLIVSEINAINHDIFRIHVVGISNLPLKFQQGGKCTERQFQPIATSHQFTGSLHENIENARQFAALKVKHLHAIVVYHPQVKTHVTGWLDVIERLAIFILGRCIMYLER